MALSVARSEMEKFIPKQRLATTFRRYIPKMTDHDLPIGSDVLLYKERPRSEWVGPYKVIAGYNKNLLLIVDGRIIPLTFDKIKIY